MSGDSSTSQTKCFMCGKPATDRCSKCAKEGSYSLFFCSPEHQKLLWPIHRRVCGKNSNPFKWPRLSDAEADLMISSKDEPAELMELPDGTERYRSMEERWQYERMDGEWDLVEALNSLRKSYKGPPIFTPWGEQRMLAVYRAFEYIRQSKERQQKLRSGNPVDLFRVLANPTGWDQPNVFVQLSSYIEVYLPFPRYSQETHDWWTDLMHRWLAITYLADELEDGVRRTDPRAKEVHECGKWVANDTLRFIREVIVPNDPEAAKGPLKEFLQWTMEYGAD